MRQRDSQTIEGYRRLHYTKFFTFYWISKTRRWYIRSFEFLLRYRIASFLHTDMLIPRMKYVLFEIADFPLNLDCVEPCVLSWIANDQGQMMLFGSTLRSWTPVHVHPVNIYQTVQPGKKSKTTLGVKHRKAPCLLPPSLRTLWKASLYTIPRSPHQFCSMHGL
jgi:hypothetical protein